MAIAERVVKKSSIFVDPAEILRKSSRQDSKMLIFVKAFFVRLDEARTSENAASDRRKNKIEIVEPTKQGAYPRSPVAVIAMSMSIAMPTVACNG